MGEGTRSATHLGFVRTAVLAITTLVLLLAATGPAHATTSSSATRAFTSGLLSNGDLHSCAVVTGHKVRCWGYGGSGALGNNATDSIGDSAGSMAAASDLALPADAAAITSGGATSCVLRMNRKVRCWGNGGRGVLGNGATHNVGDNGSGPRRIQDATDVPLPGSAEAVTASGSHTCAILAGSGKVRCWGSGVAGQLGSDDTQDIGTFPAWSAYTSDVLLPQPAKAIAASGANTCVILINGAVRCWGDGQYGANGNDGPYNIGDSDGSMANAEDVYLGVDGTGHPLRATAITVGAGPAHACAILETGKVRCWGYGASGQLGNDATANIGATPGSMEAAHDVPLPANAAVISAGSENTCAVLVTGKVRCWGAGYVGTNGNDATDDVGASPGSMAAASDVPLPANALTVSVGTGNACALLVTGKVRCWGRGLFGANGNDSSASIGDVPGSMAAASDLAIPALTTAGADLALTAFANPERPAAGTQATITVIVRNDGTAAATGVAVSAPVPAATTLAGSSVTQGTRSGSTWTVGTIAPGASATLTLDLNTQATYFKTSATYEISQSSIPDPDSEPGDGVDGQDDLATVPLTATRPPASIAPPDKTWSYTFSWRTGSAGTGNGQFDQPYDVAVDDAKQTLWVSDYGNSRVQGLFYGNGAFLSKFGVYGGGLGEMRGPRGLAYYKQRLFVVDSGAYLNPRVHTFTTAGTGAIPAYDNTFATVGSFGTPGSTDEPADVDVSTWDNHAYVSDRIVPGQEYDEDLNPLRGFGAGFNGYPGIPAGGSGADGIAVDPKTGWTYVADATADVVRVYDETGQPAQDADHQPVGPIGGPGTQNGQFDTPRGVAIDRNRRQLFVVDSGNGRVQIFTLTGAYLTSFGAPGTDGENGHFDHPRGITVGAGGDVYVADTGNNRVQVYTAKAEAPPVDPVTPTDPGNPADPGKPADPGTPSPCTAPYTVQAVTAGLAKIKGCIKQDSATKYSTSGRITLNGVPLDPPGSKKFVFDKGTTTKAPTLGVQDNDSAGISLAGAQLYKGPLSLKLPTSTNAVAESVLGGQVGGSAKLFGLKLKGSFGMSLGRDSNGLYYASFALTVALPDILKKASGDGGPEAAVAVKVDENGKVDYNGVKIQLTGLRLGPLTVQKACFALMPTSSEAGVKECDQPTLTEFPRFSFSKFSKDPVTAKQADAYLACKPDKTVGAHWSAALALELPTPERAIVAAYGSGNGADLRSLGGFGQNLGIPIAEGVSLETLGAGVCLPTKSTPELAIKGTVGVGLVATGGGRPLVNVDGSITYRGSTSNPSKFSLGFDGDVFIRDFGQIGSGGITVNSAGAFSANLSVSTRVAGVLVLTGSVRGAYQPALPKATPPVKQAFYVGGGLTLCPPPGDDKTFCISGSGVFSNIGVAACARATTFLPGAGVGYTWDTKKVDIIGGACSFEAWTPVIKVRAAGGPLTFTVPPGASSIAFRAVGTTGSPGIRVTGPGATDITLPADIPLQSLPKRFLIRSPDDKSVSVALGDLKPGTYTITALDAANPVTKLDTAKAAAPFRGTGKVTAARKGARRLTLRYVQPDGASISLLEQSSRGGKVVAQQTIAPTLNGARCPGSQPTIDGGTQRCATVTFTPTRGPGGARSIVAVVSRSGQAYDNVPVARFTVAAPAAPPKPSRVQITRKGTTVSLRWAPSTGADRLGVAVEATGVTTHSVFLPARCAGLRVTGIPKGAVVRASIAGIRYDGFTGHAARVRLKARAAKGGAGGRALRGPVCQG